MGLDQYAYCAARAGQSTEWWDGAELDPNTNEYRNTQLTKPRDLAYWRKHPNLHGWMEQLWIRKRNAENKPVVEDVDNLAGDFNGVELELTWQDLDQLEKDIQTGSVANLQTSGFFFGNPSDDYYREKDLEFIKRARAELFSGLKVFYNSSW